MATKAAEDKIAHSGGLAAELQQTFRSFQHRNFRRYFFGYSVSLCGTWMQNVALSWLVYKMTGSALLLGVVEFASLFPVMVFGLVGGNVADRFNRKKILQIALSLLMLQSCVLAFLTITDQIALWHILALATVSGILVAFEIPARQALLVNMVDKTDFINAVSLNSSMFSASRIIGPALAAFTIRFAGEGVCFAINSVSYLGALLALSLITIPPTVRPTSKSLEDTIAGLKYAFQTPEIRRVLRYTALLTLCGGQFMVLLPVIAKQVLHQDVEAFGTLRACASIGALVAALTLANRGSREMLTPGVGIAGLVFGCALAVFALSSNFWFSTAIAIILGCCLTFQLSGCHSLLQISVPEHLRGRLMSVWTIVVLGISPLGSLAIGWAAAQYGPALSLTVCSILIVISSIIYLRWKV